MIHLYWATHKPWLFQGVSEGFAACGVRAVRKDLTIHKDDVTCKACKKLIPTFPTCMVRPDHHVTRGGWTTDKPTAKPKAKP